MTACAGPIPYPGQLAPRALPARDLGVYERGEPLKVETIRLRTHRRGFGHLPLLGGAEPSAERCNDLPGDIALDPEGIIQRAIVPFGQQVCA